MSSMKLSGVAYEKIKELIRKKRFLPGDPLPENVLSEILRMSRTPIREALHKLEEEELIIVKPHIGAFVATINFNQLCNLYEAREAIEGMIVRLNCKSHIRNEPFTALKERIEALQNDSNEANRREQLRKAGNELHDLLRDNCGNPILQKTYLSISLRLNSYAQITHTLPVFYDESAPEHLKIIEAVIAKDPQEAENAARLHVRNSFKRVVNSSFQ